MSGLRAPFAAATLLAALGVLSSCAVGPGYGDGGYAGGGYVGGYYDPCCYSGNWGWGGHYHVGPPAGGGYRPGGGHPAPGGGGHPAPGGPEHGGGGGEHGGGGHGGGGHGGGAAPSIPGHPR
jgi:hypothetical protein